MTEYPISEQARQIDEGVPVGTKIILPEFAGASDEIIRGTELEIIRGVNAEGCVDPRDSLAYLKPQGALARLMHNDPSINYNPNVLREHHHPGAERSPGASFGKAMSLAAAVPELSAAQAVDIVREWEESEGRSFTLHQDNHSDGLGCGHVDRASQDQNEELYGISGARVREMRDYIRQSTQEGQMTVETPVLKGSHKEKGVLVVVSESATVASTDGKNEFFRFDATRHDKSLERLATFARTKNFAGKEEKIDVSFHRLNAAATQQRNATLRLLAADLPIFEIDLRGKVPQVTPRGIVPRPIVK